MTWGSVLSIAAWYNIMYLSLFTVIKSFHWPMGMWCNCAMRFMGMGTVLLFRAHQIVNLIEIRVQAISMYSKVDIYVFFHPHNPRLLTQHWTCAYIIHTSILTNTWWKLIRWSIYPCYELHATWLFNVITRDTCTRVKTFTTLIAGSLTVWLLRKNMFLNPVSLATGATQDTVPGSSCWSMTL